MTVAINQPGKPLKKISTGSSIQISKVTPQAEAAVLVGPALAQDGPAHVQRIPAHDPAVGDGLAGSVDDYAFQHVSVEACHQVAEHQGAVDAAHSAAPQRADDLVAAVEDLARRQAEKCSAKLMPAMAMNTIATASMVGLSQ